MTTKWITGSGKQVEVMMMTNGLIATIDGKAARLAYPHRAASLMTCWINSGPLKGKLLAVPPSAESAINAMVAAAKNPAAATRAAKAREYDALNNEGGDGYNPHRDSDPYTDDNTPTHPGTAY